MSFRRIMLVAAAIFFGAVIWQDPKNEFPYWPFVVVLFAPTERLKPETIEKLIKAWKE